MIFDKPSTRTRVSFDVGMRQLGGETIMLTGTEMQLGRSETIADTAKVLSRYVDAIMIRTTAHDRLIELTENATIPVINGLTDDTHPCQIMADILTFEEHRGPVAGKTFAWTGDGNNVLHSLLEASARFGFNVNIAVPAGQRADGEVSSTGRAPTAARSMLTRIGRGSGQRRRLRRHRQLGVDGPGAPRARPQCLPALPGQRRADEAGQAGRAVHALPAGASRRGSDRRGDRRPATRWCSTRRKTGCTPRRRCSPGASALECLIDHRPIWGGINDSCRRYSACSATDRLAEASRRLHHTGKSCSG